MRRIQLFRNFFICLGLLLALSRCGIATYPGQPGVVTNSYSKIDLEYLEEPGLFVYETVYDNRAGGKGVAAIVTKLYPNAKTFTSNVRTNADGTVFRTKTAYKGADVQMIALPATQQVHMSPHHKIALTMGYEASLDEVDDKNIAEEDLFHPAKMLSAMGIETKKLRWDLLRAGTLRRNGNLFYEITSIDLGDKTFVPSEPFQLETSLFQNSVKSTISAAVKAEAVQFLEGSFPKGFKGTAGIHVKGQTTAIAMKLSLHTPKTMEASGMRVTMDATPELWNTIVRNFNKSEK
jgi:hypothetical protein